jgi:hypothetical protein
VALRVELLFRLKKTVPRKMATVTHRTPRLPQKTPLQPELNTGAESNNVLRSADIQPPLKLASLPSSRPKPPRSANV